MDSVLGVARKWNWMEARPYSVSQGSGRESGDEVRGSSWRERE